MAFLLALGILAVASGLFAASPVWHIYGWLPQDRLSSDRLRVTHALATRWRTGPPDVLFVGGSQIREALPTEAFMEQSLSRICGRRISVFNATTSAQPPESSWAIVDILGPKAPALVVTGVNLLRDDRSRAGARRLARALLPLGKPRNLSVEMGALELGSVERLRNSVGIMFTDAAQAILSRETPRSGGPFDGPHNHYVSPGIPFERRTIDDKYLLLVASQTPEALTELNVATYRHFGNLARSRGGRMIYLLPPVSPQSAAALAPLESRTRRGLAQLASVGDLLDLGALMRMIDSDFHDSVHMLSSGRERIWPTLERALTSRLPECKVPGR